MGYLVNPISFRLGASRGWSVQTFKSSGRYLGKFLFFEENNIKNFVTRIFSFPFFMRRSFFLHNIRVFRTVNFLNIVIFFFDYRKALKEKNKYINVFTRLRGLLRNDFYSMRFKRRYFYKRARGLRRVFFWALFRYFIFFKLLFLRFLCFAKGIFLYSSLHMLRIYIYFFHFFFIRSRFLLLVSCLLKMQMFTTVRYARWNWVGYRLVAINFMKRIKFFFWQKLAKYCFLVFKSFYKNFFVNIELRRIVRPRKTSFFLSRMIMLHLIRRRSVSYIMSKLIRFLNHSRRVRGYKIVFAGRIVRKSRATFEWFKRGRYRTSKVDAALDYCSFFVVLKYGICGVKLLINQRKTLTRRFISVKKRVNLYIKYISFFFLMKFLYFRIKRLRFFVGRVSGVLLKKKIVKLNKLLKRVRGQQHIFFQKYKLLLKSIHNVRAKKIQFYRFRRIALKRFRRILRSKALFGQVKNFVL